MGISKKIMLTSMITLIGISLMGCNMKNDNKLSTEETNYYYTTIDGKRKYYSEENENIVGVKNISEVFLGYAVGTDYRDGEYLKEYDCYAKEQKEINDEYNVREDTEELVISWELILELNSYELKEIEFYKLRGKECATATLDYISTVTNATDEYMEDSEMEMNVPYIRTMELNVTKEDNEWKVIDYGVGKREKVE